MTAMWIKWEEVSTRKKMMTLLLPKVKSLLRKEIMCVNDPVDSEFEK